MADEQEQPKEEEEKQVEEKKEEEEGDNSSDSSPISLRDAEKVAERLENANKETQKLVERQEALRTQEVLGGKSAAGQAPAKPKELTDEEYKDKVMAGETPE